MSGFVSSPPSPVSPDGDTIEGGGFWPDVDVNLFRDTMRIGGQAIAQARVHEALIGAIIAVDIELARWQADQVAAGFAKLDDVPAPRIGGRSVKASLWQRAVFSHATADLLETHRDVTATGEGQKRADENALTPDDHRRNAIHAIRDLLAVTRTGVELI